MTTAVKPGIPADRSAGVQLTDYQLRLPSFEGPLDVLLRLIEREQLPIADLSLVQVTEQFLDAMRGLDEAAPPALIADFATVGTRLALLKSRSLLPRPPVAEEETDSGDLVRQLLRYRAYKDAAGHLAGRDVVDHSAFHAAGRSANGVEAVPVRLADHPPATLVRVLRRRLSQIAQPPRVYAAGRVVSLREMVSTVARRLASRGTVRFSDVAAECQSRVEVQTAFLAGLVLVRRGMADAEQPELFGEITLRAIAAPGGEYMAGLAGDVTADFEPPRGDEHPDPAGQGVRLGVGSGMMAV
ncbi:MAG TPA: ScpA family protein [Thermomicrobiales bacterium]|nr:ScpA family protein [Thermomicrobiales bacterium]